MDNFLIYCFTFRYEFFLDTEFSFVNVQGAVCLILDLSRTIFSNVNKINIKENSCTISVFLTFEIMQTKNIITLNLYLSYYIH